MPRFAPTFLRRSPGLLLLGLLALLLWGQCGLLFPGSTTAPGRVLVGYALSTDSLRTKVPATLYVTVLLRNELHRPVVLDTLEGNLRFNGRAFAFAGGAPLPGAPLAAGAKLRRHIAIPVPLPPDSLALLRQKLQTDHLLPTDPRLSWRVRYDTEAPPHSRTLRVMQPYLPLLKPAKKAAGTGVPVPAAPR
jgi:hypothetical protein